MKHFDQSFSRRFLGWTERLNEAFCQGFARLGDLLATKLWPAPRSSTRPTVYRRREAAAAMQATAMLASSDNACSCMVPRESYNPIWVSLGAAPMFFAF